jgi:hypothetical protein
VSYEHIWVLIGIFALALWAGLVIWARHLREKKRLALREMIHEERMAALEKGADLSQLPADLSDAVGGAGTGPDDDKLAAGQWIQRAAFAAGFLLILGGIGMGLALQMLPGTPELRDLQAMAPLGAIPVLVGAGLLLYAWVDRRLFQGGRP